VPELTDVETMRRPLGAARGTVETASLVDTPEPARDLVRVSLSGEVDMYTSAEIRERLAALYADGWQRIVIDMSGVTFLDSAGLAVLVAALRRAERRGATLMIEDARPNVSRILELTHLTAAFGLGPATPSTERREGEPSASEPASS
jgi:anti-sigma B factor antagonist